MITVKYWDIPEGAKEDMVLTGTGQAFVEIEGIKEEQASIPYASLESGIWRLDGKSRILPDVPAAVWWSSTHSDESGLFAEPPVLELVFTEKYSATGLTLCFSPATDQWCSHLQIQWYRENVLLREMTVRPDSPRHTEEMFVEGFTKIRITFLQTNTPESFVKLTSVQVGRVIHFGQTELVNVNLVNEADPTLTTLTADAMTVTLRGRSGLALRPQQRQKMELYRDESLLGVHYIAESTREGELYTFQCQSAIGLMEDTFLGGIYVDEPIKNLLDVLLGEGSYVLHPSFSETAVSGYLGICTRREALQQIAFTIGALVRTQGSEAVQILPLSQTVADSILPGEIFTGAKLQTTPRYGKITVTAHSYVPEETEETLIAAEKMAGEDILITFPKPYHSYAVTGGTITESGSNYVRLTASGEVTLKGKTYLHRETVHSLFDEVASLTEQRNVLSVEQATLITSGNVQQVLQRLFAAAQLRQKLIQKILVRQRQVGQKVAVANPWGTQLRGYISQMDGVLTGGGYTADVVILGSEVPATGVYGYAGEMYAGEEVLMV